MAKPYKKYTPEELDAAIEEWIEKRKAAYELRIDAAVNGDPNASNAAFREWRRSGQRLRKLNDEKRRRAQIRLYARMKKQRHG